MLACSGQIVAHVLMSRMCCEDCPYVPFAELKSEEAQARLSVCKPISGLQEKSLIGGVERYAHNSGEVPISLLYSLCAFACTMPTAMAPPRVRAANHSSNSLGQFPNSVSVAACFNVGLRVGQAERALHASAAERVSPGIVSEVRNVDHMYRCYPEVTGKFRRGPVCSLDQSQRDMSPYPCITRDSLM